jgi:hypothetical protein
LFKNKNKKVSKNVLMKNSWILFVNAGRRQKIFQGRGSGPQPPCMGC